MGRKIFVSYKYGDSNIAPLSGRRLYGRTTVRDYVDLLELLIGHSDNIYKGESDDEDLSMYSEDAIWEKLKSRIFDSSVTLVMISPGMKEEGRSDRSQWIPWEVSFSLKETTRNDRTSHSNAMLSVVLPDREGKYDYFLYQSDCRSMTVRTERTFEIIRRNMFNRLNPIRRFCPECSSYHYYGDSSYIEPVKWCDFINAPGLYIDKAVSRQKSLGIYKISKEV